MKKRGFFFVALGLTAATVAYAADQNYTDLGTAQTLEVTENKLSDAQVNTGSYVTVITREQIGNYHAETLDKLLQKAAGITNYAAGSIGSLSTPRVMGATAQDTLIYIDGMQVNPVYSTFDLTTVPTAIIDHIEIIKAGSGNMNAVAAGGIINIVTKKADGNATKKFTLTAENGSYLPRKYTDSDGDKEHNWKGLVDTQKLDLTYADAFGKINLLVNAGGVLAKNHYTYDAGGNTYLQTDNKFNDAHVNANVSGTVGEVTFRSNNMFSYQDYDSPAIGYYSASTQKTLTLTTSNSAVWRGFTFYADERYSSIEYEPDSPYGYDKHHMNKLHFGTDYTFTFSEDISLKVAGDFTYDKMIDHETDEDYDRVVPKFSASSSIYLAGGTIGLYPMASVSLYSDMDGMKKFSTSDSFGMVWQALEELEVTANLGYAETVPRFDQLHGSYGNENLKTEKATSFTVGANYTYDKLLVSKTTAFAKYFNDLINYDTSWIPQNIDDSAFFGLEEYIGVTPLATDRQALTVWGSYLLNKSYDLSGDYDIGDDQPIRGNHTHLVKLGADYRWEMLTVTFDVAWNSEPEDTDTDSYWLANAAVTAQVTQDLSIYGAIDNLFDTDYTSQAGTAMPGMKIRLGGTWKF